jgi:hypothetical protein
LPKINLLELIETFKSHYHIIYFEGEKKMIKREGLFRKKIKTRFIIISLLISFLLAFQTINVCADDFNNNFPEMNSIGTLNKLQLLSNTFDTFPDPFKQTKFYNDFQNNFNSLKIDFPDYNFDLKTSKINNNYIDYDRIDMDINNFVRTSRERTVDTAVDYYISIAFMADPVLSMGKDISDLCSLFMGASSPQDLIDGSPLSYEFEFCKPLWKANIYEYSYVLDKYSQAFNIPDGPDYYTWLDTELGRDTGVTVNDFNSDWTTWERPSSSNFNKPISSFINNLKINNFNTNYNNGLTNNYDSSYLNDDTFNDLNTYNSWNTWNGNSWDTSGNTWSGYNSWNTWNLNSWSNSWNNPTWEIPTWDTPTWNNPTWNNPTWNTPKINNPSWDWD